jgi:acetolactate decarboxylase
VPFFVWTQVSTWNDHVVPESARDLTGIQPFIKRTATDSGIDTDRAFPFMLIGTPEWIDFHVWESVQGDSTTGTGRSTRVPFQLESRPLRMIGFYSEQHRGIFIPNDSFVHVHLCTDDGAASGHLDQARWGAGMTLRLPSPGPEASITTARG